MSHLAPSLASEGEQDNESIHYATSPDSDVGERSPPSSSEAMQNYLNFVLQMAKSIDLPTHHPKPRHTDHIFGRISTEDASPVHLTMFPLFLSMAEKSFKKISLSLDASRAFTVSTMKRLCS
ncbi:hypothetical protein JRQ81_014148 [Phrynocephalus forsythii]|uniref:Uncharacterized protein n=1 Tax=Phrynocephalus forsythii TaxID=171643 RepID=A0A9Q0XW64_9SAUR|nr:hypothetical protein JRQ81_014148 [Phrynocephalus forsythii]